jgi:hypothetical protein
LISPSFFGSILAGTIIGIGLVIRGIQTVFASQRKIYRNSFLAVRRLLVTNLISHLSEQEIISIAENVAPQQRHNIAS